MLTNKKIVCIFDLIFRVCNFLNLLAAVCCLVVSGEMCGSSVARGSLSGREKRRRRLAVAAAARRRVLLALSCLRAGDLLFFFFLPSASPQTRTCCVDERAADSIAGRLNGLR